MFEGPDSAGNGIDIPVSNLELLLPMWANCKSLSIPVAFFSLIVLLGCIVLLWAHNSSFVERVSLAAARHTLFFLFFFALLRPCVSLGD